jgi:hypothetical protein
MAKYFYLWEMDNIKLKERPNKWRVKRQLTQLNYTQNNYSCYKFLIDVM